MTAGRLTPRSAALWVMLAAACAATPVRAQTQTGEERARSNTSFEVTPTGYLQFDLRTWPDWDVTPGSGRMRFDTFELRRARPGVEGRWKSLRFEASVDPFDLDDVWVRDAYVEFRVGRRFRLRTGQFKVPGSAEYGRSAADIEFMERSALAQWVAPGRDIGASVLGTLPRRLSYEAGVFAGDANGRKSRSGVTSAGRIAWRGDRDLTIGASASVGRVTAVDSESANGLEAHSPAGYRFFDRLYVNGLRTRTGADMAWTPGRGRYEPNGCAPPSSATAKGSTSKICLRRSATAGALRSLASSAGARPRHAAAGVRSSSGFAPKASRSTTPPPPQPATACGFGRPMSAAAPGSR